MTPIQKINKLCKDVLKLTDADFKVIEGMAMEQSTYIHPLKMATVNRMHELGAHNFKVLEALQNLKYVIKSGKEAVSKKKSKPL